MGYEKQIGIIVPSSGIVTEMVFHRYAPVHIGISTARVKFNYVSFSGLSDMMDLVSVAASDLCCVEPNIIVFSRWTNQYLTDRKEQIDSNQGCAANQLKINLG